QVWRGGVAAAAADVHLIDTIAGRSPAQSRQSDGRPCSAGQAAGGQLASVFVPVPGVGRMPVAVVDVVGVIAVLNRLVAAVRTVLMKVLVVHDVRFELALVIVPVVLAMSVPVVQVVDMVPVLDSHVA